MGFLLFGNTLEQKRKTKSFQVPFPLNRLWLLCLGIATGNSELQKGRERYNCKEMTSTESGENGLGR